MGVRITKSICNLLFLSTFGRSCGLVRCYIRVNESLCIYMRIYMILEIDVRLLVT